MNIANIIKCDIANGTGIRLSIFVSGCKNHCPGCFQPETWGFDYGTPYTKETLAQILEEVGKPQYAGVTFLGGDPMEIENQESVAEIIAAIKEANPEKDVWIYTGYTYDKDLLEGGKRHTEFTDQILQHSNVLVDGRFELDKKDISLRFRGSSNQRVIDLKQSTPDSIKTLF